ncbi:SH2 domain-containing protein [Tirmania nivea]|nr:SH2 domain-containing protein [Tirmania nivea]
MDSGDEEEELVQEEFDEDTGKMKKKSVVSKKKPNYEGDSSEEDDEDDEEELSKVQAGFIVNDEEEEEEEEEDDELADRSRIRRKKAKRRRREEAEEEDLDEDDFDLMRENTGVDRKFKRLKRDRHSDVNHIFDDDDVDAPNEPDDYDDISHRRSRPTYDEEMDDFIEEDELEGEEGQLGSEDEMAMTGRRRDDRRRHEEIARAPNIDRNKLDEMEQIFGTAEYDHLLVTELDEVETNDAVVELKDVFEESHLAERMLTEADNEIRLKDIPERFQLARKPYEHLTEYQPDDDDPDKLDRILQEEAEWICKQILPRKKRFPADLRRHFQSAVFKCLQFFIKDNVEVPFVFQHRKDYLIHAFRPDGDTEIVAEKLLNQDELWDILDFDLKWRAFVEKRKALQRTYDALINTGVIDEVFESMVSGASTNEDLQDLQDYLHFQYHTTLKDAHIASNGLQAGNTKRRPGGGKTFYERIRHSRVYDFVKAFGITADQFAVNVEIDAKREFCDDPEIFPHEMSEQFVDESEFLSSESVITAAKRMLAEEIYMSPRLRKCLRPKYFAKGRIHVNVTEMGVRKIDDQHQYYEFKYLRKQQIRHLLDNPSMFLRMLKAEEEGLVEVQLELPDVALPSLYDLISSENMSDVANAWNNARKDVVDMAMEKISKLMQKTVKENIKTECEDRVAKECREIYGEKLDQSPYKPKGLDMGQVPTVMTISCGHGEHGKDAIVGIYMDELGRVFEQVKYPDLRDEQSRSEFVEVLRRRKPEVIGVAGFSVATHRLFNDLKKLIDEEGITVAGENDDDRHPLEVIYVNDEVARLYQNSDRARLEYPEFPPLARYCIGLARYLQSPLLEYAALGKDIVSILFHPAQQLLPQDKLMKKLESAMVDIVNMVGVNINDALKSQNYVGNLLPYVSGLGPRKASSILKSITANGGRLTTRAELVGDPDKNLLPVVGGNIFVNCASFIWIEYDSSEPGADYLDNTRVHPEDYDLGRKMAADALELDEEDIQTMVNTHGPGAVVSELINSNQENKVNDLILEEYAEELEKTFNQKKRATLETIRAELQHPYEELRKAFKTLSFERIFTMLTGETNETLFEGMVVPVNIRRVADRYISVRLDCGIDGNVTQDMIDNSGVSVHAVYAVGQTVQAKILSLERKSFFAEMSLRESDIRNGLRRFDRQDRDPEEWDDVREERDRAKLAIKNQEQQRTVRVIKHPLFRPFNSRQAEEYLSKLYRGDAVIRPSSMGMDHIAITWKIADGIYQHVDVLELDKENEFTVGKLLRVMGKYIYTDLDELMHLHIKAMARKVDEMVAHDKFQEGTRENCEKWLTSYSQANPKRSSYRFCFDPKHPGYFDLVFKAGLNAKIQCWKVKVVPNAFQLRDNDYPDMTALCNVILSIPPTRYITNITLHTGF